MSSLSPDFRSRRPRPRRRPNSDGNSSESGPQKKGGSGGNRRGGRRRSRNGRGPVDSGYEATQQDGQSSNSTYGNGNSNSGGGRRGGGGGGGGRGGSNRGGNNNRRRGGGGGRGRRQKVPIGEIPALKMIQQGISIDPFERIKLETTSDEVTTRALDLVAPIGRGQRCLIVAPPMAGKTTLLIKIANAITTNYPDIKLYTLLVDERPEEVTHFRRSTESEIHAASSDMSAGDHIQVSEACINECLERVLEGEDVVLLLDSITRLARAYNTMVDSGGRTLSGGLDAGTMLVPRQIFGSARKIEDGGSLTIIGTALVDTGSRMDEVIFQEFKGTGNMELFLSRELFQKRIFPCVDIEKSGTRKEEKLASAEDIARVHLLRRHMTAMKPHEAMQFLLELISRYKTNRQLLESLVARTAKK